MSSQIFSEHRNVGLIVYTECIAYLDKLLLVWIQTKANFLNDPEMFRSKQVLYSQSRS
jgi:hypothetical protein